jgi:hypothetical protein
VENLVEKKNLDLSEKAIEKRGSDSGGAASI